MTDLLVPPTRGYRLVSPDQETPVPEPTGDASLGEAELWAAWKRTGSLELRNRLILRYSPLVKYVSGRVRSGLPRSVEHADVVSEGMIGLIDALERFEPERELAFPTYAVPRIRGAILDAVRAGDWVPRSVRARAKEIEATRTALHRSLQRPPEDDEVADELGLTVSEVRDGSRARTWVAYASADELADLEELAPDLDDAFDDAGLRDLLMPAVRALPERDRIVIALYFFEGLTLAEVGRVLGVTESRVSQLRSRATKALREALEAQRAH
jgi:RNA polymerase sigma factor for flagellar operon FliA